MYMMSYMTSYSLLAGLGFSALFAPASLLAGRAADALMARERGGLALAIA